MPETLFKLFKLDEDIRYAVFPDPPTWEALASLLEERYDMYPTRQNRSSLQRQTQRRF
jgi:hypothetical protein